MKTVAYMRELRVTHVINTASRSPIVLIIIIIILIVLITIILITGIITIEHREVVNMGWSSNG